MAEKELSVKMLGEITLSCGSASVSMSGSRSYKTWLMVAHLLSHRHRWVPQEEIIQSLGGGEKNLNPTGAVRATLLRARRMLEPLSAEIPGDLILSRGGALRWNPKIHTTVDAEEFESLVQSAFSYDGEERLDLLMRAISIMSGDFLYRFSGEPWVSSLTAYYKNLFVEAAEEAVGLLSEKGSVDEIISISLKAFASDPYSDSFCRHLMQAYMQNGDYDEAENAYRAFRDRLINDLGVEPEDETKEIYTAAVRRLGENYLTLDMIKDELREMSPAKGPMICDYSMFKLFYRAEARSADRRGDAIHVGVLSVTGKDGKTVSDRIVRRAMEDLRESIHSTLRIGDVAASCSGSQFIILLVQANYENSAMVCRRVINRFNHDNPRCQVEIRSDVMPLEPIFF
ncbi:MAG: bacterial transcriptional activator domain-containing protein [Oscillospiraceae bacterium]|nr:bacterial transcriptional activator domain-containing protein [Oscillospiraceae bacterium]